MYESFSEIELIARHHIAERVRHSPRHPSAADPPAPARVTAHTCTPPPPVGAVVRGRARYPDRQDLIATPRRQ